MLSGISGPLILFMLPIAWWQTLRSQNRLSKEQFRPTLAHAIIVSLCVAVQLFCLLTNTSQRVGGLAPSYSRFVHIVANQIILVGTLGPHDALWIYRQPFWQPPTLPTLVSVCALCATGLALRYGPTAYRMFVMFSSFIVASALLSPMVAASDQWYAMQAPGSGGRYYFCPMLAWFITILLLAHKTSQRFDGKARSWPFFLALSPFLIGVMDDFRYATLSSTGYEAAAARFDAAPSGTTVTFPQQPGGLNFTLTKH